MEEQRAVFTALTRALAAASTLLLPLVVDRAHAAELDLEMVDPDLELVTIDSDPKESFLAIHLDTAGRIFVGGREAIFIYEPDDGGGYRPRRELVRFPPHSWVYDLTVRGGDLYALTISALYVIRGGALPGDAALHDELTLERLIWGVPLGHVHQCLHGMAWGPEGDLYFAMGDPHPGEYMDFNRRDHWWHWTFFSRTGEKLQYSGVGGVLRCRPDGSRLEVVAEGTRNSCGLAFDRRWNLFTNDNDHESLPQDFVPGRLLHVTRKAYFSWPRGWMVRKEPDRADLLETLVPDLGRFVPVGLTHTPGGGGIALRATDMLRFGYLLLREGRWRDRQVVPADYVRHCGRTSPYNPHYPFSLQFKVNTDGFVPELPRDAFWKGGSGGHVLYVVPSLDLVVWKLGGRDGQYTEGDTGLPEHPEAIRAAQPRSGWKATIDQNTASTLTLRKVIGAIER